MDQTLIDRAKKLMLLNTAPRLWHEQMKYPGPFLARDYAMTDQHIQMHLQGERWIASRLPADGMSDRVVFDIDAKSDEDLPVRNETYQQLIRCMGSDQPGLAWNTPSGDGLRLAFRLPWTSMRNLATSDTTGPLPEALRAAGIEPGLGSLEIYPARHRCDRQLFGRGMPLLDPTTLTPLEGADLGHAFNENKLRKAVELAEKWYAAPDERLLTSISDMPRLVVPSDYAPAGPEPVLRRQAATQPGGDTIRLAKSGLAAPKTRYRSEFEVGTAMWLWPELFADIGLPARPGGLDVGRALARWLAERSNGFSAEWNDSLSDLGTAGALDLWTRRYTLVTGLNGTAPVDRMRIAALSLNPDAWVTIHLAPEEYQAILDLSRHAYWSRALSQPEMYKFEIWACICWRTAKRQLRRSPGGGPLNRVEIKAEWMAGWPWGKQYTRWRDILQEAGMFVMVHQYRAPKHGLPGRAITYEIQNPVWIRRGDMLMSEDQVERAIEGSTIQGRPVSVDEAYHALYLMDRGVNLEKRYGRSTAARVQRVQRLLRPPSLFEM